MSNVIVGNGCDRAQDLAAEVLMRSIDRRSEASIPSVSLPSSVGYGCLATNLRYVRE